LLSHTGERPASRSCGVTAHGARKKQVSAGVAAGDARVPGGSGGGENFHE